MSSLRSHVRVVAESPPAEPEASVQAVLLAGEHAWHDSPLGSTFPRCMLPVLQAPLIEHGLRWLRAGGVRRVTICNNHYSRSVRRYLDDGARLDLELSYYEDLIPRGPAGCVHDAASGGDADAVVVVESTVLPAFDLADLLEAHLASGCSATVVVRSMPQEEFGRRLLEPAGVFVFSREALEQIGESGFHDIKEMLVPKLHAAGCEVRTYRADRTSDRITDFGSYLRISEWTLRELDDTLAARHGYRPYGGGLVHESARVDSGARLVGRAVVGPRTRVERGALLIGPAIIGGDARLGGGALLSRSVVLDGARIESDARLDQCVVLTDARVERGTRLHRTIQVSANHAEMRYSGALALTDACLAPSAFPEQSAVCSLNSRARADDSPMRAVAPARET